MKRILIDGRCLLDTRSGGVRRLVLPFIESQIEQKPTDTEIVVGFTSHSPLPADLEHLPHQHVRVPNKLVILLSFFGISFEKYFNGSFDEVIYPNLDFTAKSKTPTTVLVHDLSFLIEPAWYSTKSRLWHALLRPKQLIKNASRVLTVSSWTKRDVSKILNVDINKIEIIKTADFLLSPKQQSIAQLKGKSFFLLLGANNTRKNSECVLEAFKRVREHDQTISLVITGKQVEQEGVICLNWLNDEELTWLYANTKALLYSSWYEGFGIPLIEAAQAKTPIITSTSSSLPDIAPESAILVPPHQPQLWTMAMQSVIRHG
jgi:glycosyltransferase involved in cell wall biosynthesis